METVGDRLAKAQASGDLNAIRAALLDARTAGADPAEIERALGEVDRAAAGGHGPQGVPPGADGDEPASGDAPAAGDDAAAAAAAAAAEADRQRAEAHKKRGNDKLKENTKTAAREALECFTTGLEVRCSDNVLNAQLYSNRAHVRMLLRQFVEAVDDCRKAIELHPKNMKAYWRGAKASFSLELCKNGVEFCEAGLRQDPNDSDLMKMKSACAEKLAGQHKRRAEMTATAASAQEFNADEAMALQERSNSLHDQVEALRGTIGGKQRENLSCKLTRQNLADLTPETRAYVPLGRGFLLEARERLDIQLNEQHERLEAEIPKLIKTLQELEKRKEAAEKEFNEMIHAYQQRGSSQGHSSA